MARNHTSPRYGLLNKQPLLISLGGTSATDAATAVANLGGVSIGSLGATSGLAKLNQNAELPGSYIRAELVNPTTLAGPGEVQRGSQTDFEITNFDSYGTYTVTVSAGAATIVDNKVRFTAPNFAQTVTLTVNGNSTTIYVLESKPAPPTVISPVDNSVGLSNSVTVQTTVFAMTSGVDIHQATDWQVSFNNTFTNLATSSMNDSVNLTSLSVSGLSSGIRYFVRARYKGGIYGYGAWSAVSSFTTV